MWMQSEEAPPGELNRSSRDWGKKLFCDFLQSVSDRLKQLRSLTFGKLLKSILLLCFHTGGQEQMLLLCFSISVGWPWL